MVDIYIKLKRRDGDREGYSLAYTTFTLRKVCQNRSKTRSHLHKPNGFPT